MLECERLVVMFEPRLCRVVKEEERQTIWIQYVGLGGTNPLLGDFVVRPAERFTGGSESDSRHGMATVRRQWLVRAYVCSR